ncbi:MAG: hypothetical protein WC374_08970 [Phycisphaerae bacterium]|jgi:hypothetical protein
MTITLTINGEDVFRVVTRNTVGWATAVTYYMGLQLEYANNNRQECILTENGKEVTTITITQDSVVGGA